MSSSTKFVLVSDTHGIHKDRELLKVPDGDVLLYAGDAGLSDQSAVHDFNAWLAKLPHKHKVVTFGNMDPIAQRVPDAEGRRALLPAATHILVDDVADVAGFKVFASPFTPKFYGSFQLENDEHAHSHWAGVLPSDSDVDIIMTHGPPYGYGDMTNGNHVGDAALLKSVLALKKKPLLWVTGHIHNSYGKYEVPHPAGSIQLFNAANNDLRSGKETTPFVVDL